MDNIIGIYPHPELIDGSEAVKIKRGVTELAVITLDGPRNTIRTHSGTLYADERKEVYRLVNITGLRLKKGS